MYVSDYGFAVAPSAWTTNLSSYTDKAIRSVNWMYKGLWEWTISRETNTSLYAEYVSDGTWRSGDISVKAFFNVRPVFSLSSSVAYVSGSGSAADPIVVN